MQTLIRTRTLVTVFTLLFFALTLGPVANAADFKALIRKADMSMRSKTSAAVMQMQIKTKSFERGFRLVSWQDDRGKEKALIKILGPALWRGNGTLKIGDQLKVYNPKQNHVTVIGSSMLGDSWMGSHFTNDDLVKETKLERHFKSKLVKKWSGTDPTLGQVTYYRFLLTPKPKAPVAWGRIDYVILEKGQVVLPVRSDYYRKVKQKTPSRSMKFLAIKELGGRKVPTVMMVTVAKKPGEFTKIVYRKLRFDIKIDSSKFSEQALRR